MKKCLKTVVYKNSNRVNFWVSLVFCCVFMCAGKGLVGVADDQDELLRKMDLSGFRHVFVVHYLMPIRTSRAVFVCLFESLVNVQSFSFFVSFTFSCRRV